MMWYELPALDEGVAKRAVRSLRHGLVAARERGWNLHWGFALVHYQLPADTNAVGLVTSNGYSCWLSKTMLWQASGALLLYTRPRRKREPWTSHQPLPVPVLLTLPSDCELLEDHDPLPAVRLRTTHGGAMEGLSAFTVLATDLGPKPIYLLSPQTIPGWPR